MSRGYFRTSSGLIAVLVGALWYAPGFAQTVDCKQVNDIFALANWRSLATGPFAQNSKTTNFISWAAPAKSLLKNLDNCHVFVDENLQRNTESYSYQCRAPSTTAQGRGVGAVGAAVRAVAAAWRPCLNGWTERPMFKDHEDGAFGHINFVNKQGEESSVMIARNDFIPGGPAPVALSIKVYGRPRPAR